MALVDTPVTFKLPQELIDAGGIELYAKYHGWEAQVLNGEDPAVLIDNPVTALEYSVHHIGNWLEQDFKVAYTNSKLAEDRQRRAAEAESLLQELRDYKNSIS